MKTALCPSQFLWSVVIMKGCNCLLLKTTSLRGLEKVEALFFSLQVSLGAGAKDELHVVEAEAMNYEGSPIKVTLATLKMSVQPTVRAR